MRKLLFTLLAVPLAGCAFDEGINVHNLHGTILVPKSVAPTADDVGMVYVGLYSGVDQHLGYTSPIAAPAASTAGADTFPYGGTSTGNFMTRDVRYVCQRIGERAIRDGSSNWELDFDILQFPFHEGTNLWAWMDMAVVTSSGENTFTSCDPDGGYYGDWQMEVELQDVVQNGTQWDVVLVDSELPQTIPGNDTVRELRDAAGALWGVTGYSPATDTVTVADIYSYGGKPTKSGPAQPLVQVVCPPPYTSCPNRTYYGSQFNDVLNFPGKYIRGKNDVGGGNAVGDYVSDIPVVLENLSGDVEITIDSEVP